MSEANFSKGGNLSRSDERAQLVEAAMAPGGVINEIAAAGVEGDVQLSPEEAVNVIIRPKQSGEKNRPRFEVLDDAKGAIKEAAASKADEVYQLAQQIGLRKERSIDQSDLDRIDRDKAVLIIEGGANKSSVVRRALAIQTAQFKHGNGSAEQTIFQLGSSRSIPRTKTKGEQVADNPEYKVAEEIAADFLPKDDTLTEFGLNLASALQAGYQIQPVEEDAHKGIFGLERMVVLKKAGLPRLIMVQPGGEEKLTDGIDAVHGLAVQQGQDFQPVIFTNGQYRAKSELRAEQWAAAKGLEILPPVAIGDEPGFKAAHNWKEYETAGRGPDIYVTEIAILHRMHNS